MLKVLEIRHMNVSVRLAVDIKSFNLSLACYLTDILEKNEEIRRLLATEILPTREYINISLDNETNTSKIFL
jgi:hypothetical protein